MTTGVARDRAGEVATGGDRSSHSGGSSTDLSVLHVTAPAEVGGLETVVHRLATGHQTSGHRIGILSIHDREPDGHPFVERAERAGVEIHPAVFGKGDVLGQRRWLRARIRQFGPDVIHTHGYRCDVLDATVARRLGLPTVTTVHGFTGGGWKMAIYERLQRWSLRSFDAVVAVSRPLYRELADAGVSGDRLHLVPNAWTPSSRMLSRAAARERLELPEDSFCVGWVGRLDQAKGADLMVEALAVLSRQTSFRAAVVGDGPMRESLEREVRGSGMGDRVRFHGRVPDAERLYRAFDVFVLSSRTEGTPMVLFEAMHAETPVVATRVGGVPDVLSERSAILVRPEDPGALSEAILRVRSEPGAARRRAVRARRRLEEEYAPDPWLDRYLDIYRRVA